MASDTVAVVIPAWNEADSIGPVLSEIPPESADWVFVITGVPGFSGVPGASTDNTAEIAAAHGANPLTQPRPGYGAACWAGVRAAAERDATIVAFLDGDYSDPPADLPRLLAPILDGSADLTLGCRRLSAHPDALPRHARLGNWLVLRALRLLLGRTVSDLPSFKAIRLDHLTQLRMQEMTHGWTVELIVKSLRAGLRVAEVPVPYRPRRGGRSKVSGTIRGTAGAAWKLTTCALRYARWSPPLPQDACQTACQNACPNP